MFREIIEWYRTNENKLGENNLGTAFGVGNGI